MIIFSPVIQFGLMARGLTSEEVFLGIDEVVGGLVHLNLTLPCLRHVPHPRVAGYYMKLKRQNTVRLTTNRSLELKFFLHYFLFYYPQTKALVSTCFGVELPASYKISFN